MLISPGSPDISEGSARVRRYGLAAAGIVLVVAAVVAGAIRLDRQLRPPVQTVAVTGTAAASVAPRPASPQVAADVVGNVTAVSSSAASSSAASASAAPSLPSGVSVASSPLEREIEAAFLHYWDVRSQALLNLDGSHLSEVTAGVELTRDQQQIDDLKAQNRAIKVEINYRLAFVNSSQDSAELFDDSFNKSYYVATDTKQPQGSPGSGGPVKVSYVLQKLQGTWKVVDGSRPA